LIYKTIYTLGGLLNIPNVKRITKRPAQIIKSNLAVAAKDIIKPVSHKPRKTNAASKNMRDMEIIVYSF
jgi:hypothetical protein